MLDVIICAKIEVKKIKGFGIFGGQILGSFIEMVGHPYNSAALPRVVYIWPIEFILTSYTLPSLRLGHFLTKKTDMA